MFFGEGMYRKYAVSRTGASSLLECVVKLMERYRVT